MRIGFDAKKMLTNTTGIGNYSRGVFNLLAGCEENRYVLFAPGTGDETCLAALKAGDRTEFAYARHSTSAGKEWWRCVGMVKDIRKHGIDLFHGLSNELPWGIERVCKSVVTIHDLIFIRHPEMYGKLARRILRGKTSYACRHADHIIATSEQTKEDILEFYHVAEDRVSVVYQGCNPAFYHRLPLEVLQAIQKRYGIPPRYVLSVGTIEPRKNQKNVLNTLPLLAEDIHLVLVGKRTPYQEELESHAGRIGIMHKVHFLNHVPAKDLPAIYQGCIAFAYLSYFEGFGIPVLEAMASGVPVIAATGSCLQEVGGDDSWYCSPNDYYTAAEHIRHILANPEETRQRVQSGRKHIEMFSDQRVKERLLAVYAQATRK